MLLPTVKTRAVATLAALLCVFALGSRPASAASTLRVGKAFPGVFDFTPLDVGMQEGFFKKHGLEIEESSFNGSAKLQQALAADAIDIGLASGPELAFVEKGAPVLGVAAFMGPPAGLVLLVRNEPGIHSAADLKGKRISVSTVGSLTAWLVQELSRHEGWGANGIDVTPLGGPAAQIAAMRDDETDGMVTDLVKGTIYQRKHYGRIIVRFEKIVPNFITHVTYARRALIKNHPEEVRAFLAGWFEAVAYMRTHKAETVKIAAAAMNQPADIVEKAYDVTMPALSSTGRFEPKALAVLKRSFVEMGLLPTEPDMSKLYTEAFLPGGAGKEMAGQPAH